MKKIGLILCAVFCFCLFPAEVFAVSDAQRESIQVGDGAVVYSDSGIYFNTPTTIVLYCDTQNEAEVQSCKTAIEKMLEIIEETEQALSTDLEDSDISRFNDPDNMSVSISPITAEVVKTAKKMYEITNGYFNPCVYSFVDMYGFTPRFSNGDFKMDMPYDDRTDFIDEEWIGFLRQFLDFDSVILDETNLTLTKTTQSREMSENGHSAYFNVKLDLGGIGKGYMIDRMGEIAAESGLRKGYFSIGTSSMRLLQSDKEDGNWDLGVNHPRNKELLATPYAVVHGLRDASVSTSGDYEKYRIMDGKRYCHIIDAFSGKPLDTGICTSSVFGGSAAEGDALSTALMVMGKERAVTFMTENRYFIENDLRVMFVEETDGGRLDLYTNQTKDQFTVKTSSVRIAGYVENGEYVFVPFRDDTWLYLLITVVLAAALISAAVLVARKRKNRERAKPREENE